MSLAQLKDQAAHLPLAEQRELIAFLVAQQAAQDEELRRELARKIDDNGPAHWIEFEELQKRYAAQPR